MDDLNNITKPIEPPKIKFLDKLRYRFALTGKKSKVVTTVIGVALMAGVSFYVSYASLTRRNVSLNTDNKIGAANPSCYLELALKSPTPTPIQTPPPNLQCGATCPSGGNTCTAGMTCFNGVCRNPSCTSSANCICPTSTPTTTPVNACRAVMTPADHQTVCYPNSTNVSYKLRFDSLPTANPPYYLITDWYVGYPLTGAAVHHYVVSSSPIVIGQTYTVSAVWPGLNAYPNADHVDLSVSYNVQDKDGNLVGSQYSCSGDKNYYWTPFVPCP